MAFVRFLIGLLLVVIATGPVRAGLYLSSETFAELPAQWRGFLLDQRLLRNLAIKPVGSALPSPGRERYLQQVVALEKITRPLTAEETADLGALYVRLGDPLKALEILRKGQRRFPRHFRLVANLGTAWQIQGDLEQAAASLEQASRLAPGKWQKAEEYHLKLVRGRQRHPSRQDLDDLLGVHFLGDNGKYQPNTLAAGERKKLPAEAVAVVQQLALWLPADGKLLWQLGELANAHGDVKTAAAILDGCVTEFAMQSPELRQHRQILRSAVDELASATEFVPKSAHQQHAGLLKPRSRRPLVTRLDETPLPPISATGVNPLPWNLLGETTIGKPFKPAFPKFLEELDGKQIVLAGYMQPLGEDLELRSFMLVENPIGCWYCEMPDLSGIVLVEMPRGKTRTYTRALVKVVGRLSLNATDPENFIFVLRQAKVAEAD